MKRMRFYQLPMVAVAVSFAVGSASANEPPSDPNASGCPPLSSCVPPAASASPASRDSEATRRSAEGAEQAGRIVDSVMSGTMLVPEIAAHAMKDTASIDALSGPVGRGIGLATKGAAASAQIYRGYATEGASGAVRESAQVITDFGAEQLIVHGSAAVGGAFFGPPGAEAGGMVGKGSAYVGSLIKKLPCGDTNVEGCVTDLEFDIYDHWQTSPQCDDMGVCYDPATGRTNMNPPDLSSTSGSDDANRQRLEQDFDQTAAANSAEAAQSADQQTADSVDASSYSMQPSLFDWSALSALSTNRPVTTSAAPTKQQVVPQTPAIPAGWVPCSCPAKHAGRWFSGVLYHPEGPRC